MTVCYSADGKCLLAAGQSKSVCIYSVPDQLLVKKFDISCNMSFDGMEVRPLMIYCKRSTFDCVFCSRFFWKYMYCILMTYFVGVLG